MGVQSQLRSEEAPPSPIHGDILEVILSHVPLVDLVPASHVSKAWKRAVSFSLRHVNPIKPWLLVHTQENRLPHVTTTHAYDPRSHVWLEVRGPSISHVCAVRSSHSTLLYSLSPTKFSFSIDPLHLTWHHVDPPHVWRTDPVVALVGDCIIVAGGAWDFEDNPLVVEIYDLNTHTWDTCASMPAILKDSTASTWLSVAVDGNRMYVTEKNSCVTYFLDPNNKTWHGPYDLRPDQNIYTCVTGILHNRLIMVGAVGDSENVKSVKLWEVRGELELDWELKEIGEMPEEMVEKLKGESGCVPSVTVASMADFVYIHNSSEPEEMIVCEAVHEGHKWGSVRNMAAKDGSRMQRMVIGCADVNLEDLQRAVSENGRFVVKSASLVGSIGMDVIG